MGEARELRVRAAGSNWLVVFALVAVVVAALGGWATYTAHVAPGDTTQRQTETIAQIDNGFEHSATVSRQNPVFPIGTELRNRSTYFTSVSPVLDGRFVVSQRGLTDATTDVRARLLLRSTGEEGNTVFWSERRPLNATSATLTEGDAVAVQFALNASAIAARIGEIESALGAPGDATAVVIVETQVSGTADGEPVARTFTRELEIGLAGDTYTVGNSADEESAAGPVEIERTTTATVTRTYGPVRSVGGPVALFLGVAGLVALVVGRLGGWFTLSDRERARLEYLDDRAQFDEWIVSVRLPDDDRPIAEADSLADLVDLAIDSGAGVVQDPADGSFTVVGEEYRYVYDPPTPVESPGLSLDAGFVGGSLGGGDVVSDGGSEVADGDRAADADAAAPETSDDADSEVTNDDVTSTVGTDTGAASDGSDAAGEGDPDDGERGSGSRE